MIVTVFGSSIPSEGDVEYEQAYKLGKILAGSGISVCSGGFQGIMDAVSKGASEYEVERVGVLVDIFNAKPSQYLSKQINCSSLSERLMNLVELGDAFVVLPGGTGTMLELSLVWELTNKKLIDEKPIVCIGSMWKAIVFEMEKRIKAENRKLELVKCFDKVEEGGDYILKCLL